MMNTYRRLALAACSQGRAWLAILLAAACLAPVAARAGAMNKCVIDGKLSYQDTPCPGEPGTARGENARSAQAVADRNVDIKALERKLDRLQGRGKGMVQQQPPGPVEAPPRPQEKQALWRPLGSREQEAARITAMHNENTIRKNAESAARLTMIFEDAEKACGGKLPDYPSVGMRDEVFRNCTLHARFNNVIQIVAVDVGKVPLRLYVFASQRASRVYSIDGVITTVMP